MATQKLAEFIGTKNTETDTWQKIRAELRDDIAAAHTLAVEYDGCQALGRNLGLNEEARRIGIAKAISGPIVANPDWLLIRLRSLIDVTSVPPEAYDFFNIFLNNYSIQWAEKVARILIAALPIAKAELTAAISFEENFFADVGLPRQETPLAQGAARVVERIKASLAHYGQILNGQKQKYVLAPDPGHLEEIFSDEIATHKAVIAEIASKRDLPA